VNINSSVIHVNINLFIKETFILTNNIEHIDSEYVGTLQKNLISDS